MELPPCTSLRLTWASVKSGLSEESSRATEKPHLQAQANTQSLSESANETELVMGLWILTEPWPYDLSFLFKMFWCLLLRQRERERERERERHTQSVSGGGAERGRHRIQSRLQALSCQHQSPMWGSNSGNHEIMTWAEVGRLPTKPPSCLSLWPFWTLRTSIQAVCLLRALRIGDLNRPVWAEQETRFQILT